MGVILKIALRNMKRRKTRYILTTITLILGVSLFGGIMIVSESFNVIFTNEIDRQLGTADVLIRYDDSNDGWFNSSDLEDIVKNIENVESIAYRISGSYVFLSGTDKGNQIENSTRTAVYGIDYQTETEKQLEGSLYILDSIINGTSVDELLDYKDNETDDRIIVITESLKILLGNNFSAGERVWILPVEGEDTISASLDDTGTWLEYTVTAVVRDLGEAKDFDPENPSQVTTPSQGACLWTNISNAHELVDGIKSQKGNYTLAAIDVDDINNVERVVDKLQEDLDDTNWKVVDLKSENIEMVNETLSFMTTLLMMFALISLILAIVLIMNIFNIIKKEQEYETGMFQAIGASKFEAFKMFLTQGIIMGVIGGVTGAISSYFISYLIFEVVITTIQDISSQMSQMVVPMSFQNFEIVLSPSTMVTTILVGVISCTLAAIYPSWKASRKPIIECLNPLAQKTERDKNQNKKRFLYFIVGILLIVGGTLLLFTGMQDIGDFSGPPGSAGNSFGEMEGMGNMGDITLTLMGPTLVLLGLIILMALIIGPLVRGLTVLFRPYLRQTRLLTQKNILRHRRRTVLTFSMIALTISSLVGISVMMSSINEGFKSSIDDLMGSDVRIFTMNTPKDFEDNLRDFDAVDNVMGVRSVNILIKNESEWVGHGLLEEEWNVSISANVVDINIMKEYLANIEITNPTDVTTEEMLNLISKNDTTFVTKELADDLNVVVDDIIEINFTLGVEYANISAAYEGDNFNAKESSLIKNFKVVAIVETVPGFEGMSIIGGQSGTSYNVFISWPTYESIAINNLPGGSIDIILRQQADTGDEDLDKILSDWFELSEVAPILDNISGIEYYTSRMDYFTPTLVGDNLNFTVSVVGVRNESYGNFTSDKIFGENIILQKNESYRGSTMEKLLSTEDNVCVVYQSYVDYQNENDYPDFGIGSTVSIFSDKKDSITIPIGINETFPYNIIFATYKIPVIVNFTVVAILEDPKRYSTERYFWIAGYEIGAVVMGTENAIFINHEKARDLIYTKHKGSEQLYDDATSILIHCDNPNNISEISERLEFDLEEIIGGNWSVVDLKTRTLDSRKSVAQWFIWLEEGEDDEETLEAISTYIESEGYLMFFALTKSFISSAFSGIINLMSFMMNGILIFAIIIAMIGLTLHCLISTMARRREIGMLRSIGLTKSGVIRTISGETIIVAFLGIFAGILAGLIEGVLMVMSAPDTGFIAFKLSIPWMTIGIVVLITITTSIIGSLYPSRWAANLNIIEATRTR